MTRSEAKPYIGVTSPQNEVNIHILAQDFNELLGKTDHFGVIGHIVTFYNGQLLYKHVPVPESKLASLLESTSAHNGKLVKQALHFRTNEEGSMSDQVQDLFESSNIYEDQLSRMLQLNMTWPNIEEVTRIKKKFPDMDIVLQLGPGVFAQENEFDTVHKLEEYKKSISYILLDQSGGVGNQLDPDYLGRYFRMIRHLYPDKTVIFSGGFDDINVSRQLENLFSVTGTKDFGIDAQRRLSVVKNGSRKFLPARATAYIAKAAQFFQP